MARLLRAYSWDRRDYVMDSRYANQGGVRRTVRARERALAERELRADLRVGFDPRRDAWTDPRWWTCEDFHSFWDECWRCDGGSPNVAALGTVDFDGTYTVG